MSAPRPGTSGWAKHTDAALLAQHVVIVELLRIQVRSQTLSEGARNQYTLLLSVVWPIPLGEMDHDGTIVDIRYLPKAEFSFEPARASISRVAGTLPTSDAQVDMTKAIQVQAAGGLLQYLNQSTELNTITRFIELNLEGYLQIDKATLLALQIFKPEHHPSAHHGGSWFSPYPLTLAISFFIDESHQPLGKSIRDAIRHVCDLRVIIRRIRDATHTINDWSKLLNCLVAYRQTVIMVYEQPTHAAIPLLHRVVTEYTQQAAEHCLKVIELLQKVVDFADSKEAHRVVVRVGVDGTLDKLKYAYAAAPGGPQDAPPDAHSQSLLLNVLVLPAPTALCNS
eukprot:gene1629-2856_t